MGKKTTQPRTTKPKKVSVVGGGATVQTGDRTAAALAPPADELAARKAAAEALAQKQAALEAGDDAALESDNPAPTAGAKPVAVAKDKPKGGSKKDDKPKLTDEEKAAKQAAREFKNKQKAEKKRKKELKATRQREGEALAGELTATAAAPETTTTTKPVRTKAEDAEDSKPASTGQLNLIPRLLGLASRNVVPAAKQVYRMRNDAAIVGGVGLGYGKAGGVTGISNFLMNGFGGSEEKKDQPAPSQSVTPSDDGPAAPKTFRDKLMEQQQRTRAKMPPDRSGRLLEAIRNRSIG